MTFIERCPVPPLRAGGPTRLRVAVKDLIDMVGLPTTAGSRVVAAAATAASSDAVCIAPIRAAEARGEAVIVGKTGLHELAFGVTGINAWFGTPANPLDPARIPGGSSSGSAVAVATGEADVALGTDTGGSIRIPATCCGVAGLKTTAGLISTNGVRPLAPTLDTVGPIARDVAGLVAGMELLGHPASDAPPAARLARFRIPCAEHVDGAIDEVLRSAGFEVVEVLVPGWAEADQAAIVVLLAEAWASDGHLVNDVGEDVAVRLRQGAAVSAAALVAARRTAERWKVELAAVIRAVGPLVLPTLADDAPLLDDAARTHELRLTLPVNLAGFPALTLPVGRNALPVGLQMVGAPYEEATLLQTAAVIEVADRR